MEVGKEGENGDIFNSINNKNKQLIQEKKTYYSFLVACSSIDITISYGQRMDLICQRIRY